MRKNKKITMPVNYEEIQNLESIEGGGPFLNDAVDVLWEWIGKYVGKKTANILSTTCSLAIDYASFVYKFQQTDPSGYNKYVYTYNRHQYCCHTMHAFDGKCPGPNW